VTAPPRQGGEQGSIPWALTTGHEGASRTHRSDKPGRKAAECDPLVTHNHC